MCREVLYVKRMALAAFFQLFCRLSFFVTQDPGPQKYFENPRKTGQSHFPCALQFFSYPPSVMQRTVRKAVVKLQAKPGVTGQRDQR